MINIYYFFDNHDTWFLLLEYFLWFVQVSAVFERLLKCYSVVPISLTKKFWKHTHTHTHTPDCFSLKNHGQSFFLICNLILKQIAGFIFAISPHLERFVKFYFAKNIYIFLNIYSVKIYSFKVIQRSYSKLHGYLGNRAHCVYFLDV